jgi:hypothetical protein
MTKFWLLFALMGCLLAPPFVNGQLYPQSPTVPITAPAVGKVIDETGGGASVHTLSWTLTGAPTQCLIAIESADDAKGKFVPMGPLEDCTHEGSITRSGITVKFVRINISAFVGDEKASITYIYGGMGTVGSAAFASASLWAKLDALRAVEALKHGITKVNHCPMFVPGPGADAVPYPTDQEFQLYHEQIGSSLILAGSFGDTGANGIPSAQNTIQIEPLAQIRFESGHYFYDWKECISHRPTFSFGGIIGLTPALVMENLSSTTATIKIPNNRPMFQDAFGWSLGPKVNVAFHNSQFTAFATLGENYLLSQVTSFKQGDDTITATPVSNNVGQSALFWESGVQWKLLNTDIVNAYINKTDVLDPPFDVSFGYRNDSRFKRAGDLANITNPQAYAFFRFTVGLNKIANWNSTAVNPGKGYTFKFGVDYERRLGGSQMPNATRYYVSANLDIMQLFKPSTQPAPQAAPQPGQQQQPPPKAPHAVF